MNRIKNNKLLYFLGVLIVGVFIVLIVRFTYAYLGASINDAQGNVTINSDETDKLDFEIGEPLSIDATPTTLPENGANLVDTTTAKAILTANSTNNTAEYSYWVYFTISNNTFIYSDGSTPEIILTVTDPDGNPVTNIEDLTYGTFNGVAGFDITTQNGTFVIASDYAITSNSSTQATEQTWNFTLTYLNLSYDQSANYGNSMTTEVSMMKEENVPTIADVCTSGSNLASCIVEFNTLAGDGVEGIYYHDADLANGAGDNSYRFSGANPNNYVCFGSDAASCPSDNLYRIIGVFGNQVKLIKATSAPSSLLGTNGAYQSSYYYYWNNSTNNNTWSQSNLNTVNLNQNYLNNIGSTWSSKIGTATWYVGGNTDANIRYYPNGTPKNAYRNEITNPAESTTYSAKIGLMYVSDYYYGASPTYWTYPGYTTSSYPDGNGNSGSSYDYRAAKSSNWMNTGVTEWTITRRSYNTYDAFYVDITGYVSNYFVYSTRGVRPSFYLNSSVTLSGGSGSSADPFRIN